MFCMYKVDSTRQKTQETEKKLKFIVKQTAIHVSWEWFFDETQNERNINSGYMLQKILVFSSQIVWNIKVDGEISTKKKQLNLL